MSTYSWLRADFTEVQRRAFAGQNLNVYSLPTCMTKLHWACSGGDLFIVEFLIMMGADIECRDVSNYTPMMDAVLKGYQESAALLLQHRANVNVQSNSGKSALMTASHNNNLDMVQLLLQYKADVQQRDKDKRTALDWCIDNPFSRQVSALLKDAMKK